MRKELELATTEMTARLREAGGHAAVASAGGALLHAGLLVILAGLVAGLVQLGVQTWLAGLIVASLTMGMGYVLMNRAWPDCDETQFAAADNRNTQGECAMDDRTGRVDVPNATADAERDPDARAREIRAEIDRAREDLSETVDAIQEKLRPGNLVASAASGAADKVKDLASTATEKVKDMASTTTEKVKDMASNAAGTTEDWWEANSDSGVLGRIRSNPLPAVLAGVGLTWLVFSEGGSTRRGARGSNGGSQSPSDRAPNYARSHSILQAGAPVARRPTRGRRSTPADIGSNP